MISRQGGRASITQLQKLELPREERRMRNRTLVRCLANSQAKAFVKLKGFPNKKTARQIVDDYNHSPSSLVGQAKDRVEDLTDFMSSRACCREVKNPNQYGPVILWCLFMIRIDS